MSVILIERNRIGNFLRLRVDLYVDASPAQQRKQLLIKGSNGFRRKCQRALTARCSIGRSKLQSVVDKVELDFERTSAIRDRRSRQTSRIHIERGIPPMVHEGCEPQADFPDDLA